MQNEFPTGDVDLQRRHAGSQKQDGGFRNGIVNSETGSGHSQMFQIRNRDYPNWERGNQTPSVPVSEAICCNCKFANSNCEFANCNCEFVNCGCEFANCNCESANCNCAFAKRQLLQVRVELQMRVCELQLWISEYHLRICELHLRVCKTAISKRQLRVSNVANIKTRQPGRLFASPGHARPDCSL